MTRSHYSILFVCLGNICRSPAGENVMRQLVKEAGLSDRISCHSAGTAGYHIGKGPDKRMTSTLKSRGIPVTGAAAKLTAAHLAQHDLILTMDHENLENTRKLDPSGEFSEKIFTFTHFCQKHPHSEVPDPYYGGQDGFEEVADLMLDGCTHILAYAQSQLTKS